MYKLIKYIFIKLKKKSCLYISNLLKPFIIKLLEMSRQAKLDTRLHRLCKDVSSIKEVLIKRYYIPLITFNQNLIVIIYIWRRHLSALIWRLQTLEKKEIKALILMLLTKKRNIIFYNKKVNIYILLKDLDYFFKNKKIYIYITIIIIILLLLLLYI